MQILQKGVYELHIHNTLLLNQYMGIELPYGLFVAHQEVSYIEYTTSDGKEIIAPLPVGTTNEQFESYLEQIKSQDSLVNIFRAYSYEKVITGNHSHMHTREFYKDNERKTFDVILKLYLKAGITGFDGSHVGSVVQRGFSAGTITGGTIKTCKTRKSLHLDFVGVDFRNTPGLQIGNVKLKVVDLLTTNDQLLEQCYAFAQAQGYSRDLLDTRIDALEKEIKERQARRREAPTPMRSPLTDEERVKRKEERMREAEERMNLSQENREQRRGVITPLQHVAPSVLTPEETVKLLEEANAKRRERNLPPLESNPKHLADINARRAKSGLPLLNPSLLGASSVNTPQTNTDMMEVRRKRIERANNNRAERGLPPIGNASQTQQGATNTPSQGSQYEAQAQFEQQMEQRRKEEVQPKKKRGFFETLFRGTDN